MKILSRNLSPRNIVEFLFIAMLVGALVAAIFRMNRLEKRLMMLSKSTSEQFQGMNGSLNGIHHKRDWSPWAFNIISPADGVTIEKKSFNIVGEAPDDFIIALSRNGKNLQVTIPQHGKFVFSNLASLNGQGSYIVRAIDPDGNVTIIEELSYKFHLPKPDKSRKIRTKKPEVTNHKSQIPISLPKEQGFESLDKSTKISSKNFSRASNRQKKIALTFDGGALANAVDTILDILSRYEVKSTMFLTGHFVMKYPEAVKKIVAKGHEVGNHTWDHLHLTSYANDKKQTTLPQINKETLQEQLRRTGDLFADVTGRKMQPFWRAPYGEHNGEIRRWAAASGYRHIGWTSGKTYSESLDTVDWVADSSSSVYRSSQEILQKFLKLAAHDNDTGLAGGIILMHLGTLRKEDLVHQILPELIEALYEKNYRLVPISDLLSSD